MENVNLQRPLGGAEKLFIVLNKIAAKSFAMVGEFGIELSINRLQNAFQAIQHRHPALSAGIRMDDQLTYWFDDSAHKNITVNEVQLTGVSDWQELLEQEMLVPFDVERGPLLRVLLSTSSGKSTLLLITHHSIGDGLSLIYLFQDLLDYLSGKELVQLPIPKSLDELLGLEDRSILKDGSPVAFIPAAQWDGSVTSDSVHISKLKISKELTADIVAAARRKQTTVNGVLYAALVLAIGELAQKVDDQPILLRTPASVRKELNIGADFGLYIITKLTTAKYNQHAAFWELARAINADLTDIHTNEFMHDYINRFRQLFLRPVAVAEMEKAMRGAPGIDMMLTNLGRLTLDSNSEDIRLQELWGPFVMAADGSEQTVGALTFNNELYLSQTSKQPVSGLLEKTIAILSQHLQE